MKKILIIILCALIVFLLYSLVVLWPINAITYNEDYSEIYYNNNTYINYENYSGRYCVDDDYEDRVKIDTIPYGIFFLLGALTEFYGNDIENPDFITNSRTTDLYVRQDITFNNDSTLFVCDINEPYSFTITDITSGEIIPFSMDDRHEYKTICEFKVYIDPYPYLIKWISICERDGQLYLQDVWDSDYYPLNDDFIDDLYRLKLDTYTRN